MWFFLYLLIGIPFAFLLKHIVMEEMLSYDNRVIAVAMIMTLFIWPLFAIALLIDGVRYLAEKLPF
jgi:hypothetical protein